MNTVVIHTPAQATQAQEYAEWWAYEAQQRKAQADRRADKLPFYILALDNDELTCIGTLKQDGKCDVCFARCPKKTTLVYLHNSREVIFCGICRQELLESIEDIDP